MQLSKILDNILLSECNTLERKIKELEERDQLFRVFLYMCCEDSTFENMTCGQCIYCANPENNYDFKCEFDNRNDELDPHEDFISLYCIPGILSQMKKDHCAIEHWNEHKEEWTHAISKLLRTVK